MANQSIATSVSCDISKSAALKFVVFIGVVSLFSDFTYEGARSITGPFLAVLGASGTIVGIIAGFGELIGYALRLASGYWADRNWSLLDNSFFRIRDESVGSAAPSISRSLGNGGSPDGC